MIFLADESIDRQIVALLRENGHVVRYVTEIQSGIPDDVVLDMANRESAVLLTADKDFGAMVFRQRLHAHGIVLIRLAGLAPNHKAEVVTSTINRHTAELPHAFAVITPEFFRIRRYGE